MRINKISLASASLAFGDVRLAALSGALGPASHEGQLPCDSVTVVRLLNCTTTKVPLWRPVEPEQASDVKKPERMEQVYDQLVHDDELMPHLEASRIVIFRNTT